MSHSGPLPSEVKSQQIAQCLTCGQMIEVGPKSKLAIHQVPVINRSTMERSLRTCPGSETKIKPRRYMKR